MAAPSSFPKRASFHKILGSIAMILVFASMAIIAVKRCTLAVATEAETRTLNEAGTSYSVNSFVHSYYYKLHLLHSFSLTCSFLIIVFSLLDLVPQSDDDIKYAFHFVAVFAIFCISLATMYAAFFAYTRPCSAPDNTPCCAFRTSPPLLSPSEKKPLTAWNTKDAAMMAISVLDFFSGFLQLIVSITYFRDVRQDADECGYLHRVHNEGYIIR